MALDEYDALKQQRNELNRAISEIDSQIRHVQRQLSRSGAGRRQQKNQLVWVLELRSINCVPVALD